VTWDGGEDNLTTAKQRGHLYLFLFQLAHVGGVSSHLVPILHSASDQLNFTNVDHRTLHIYIICEGEDFSFDLQCLPSSFSVVLWLENINLYLYSPGFLISRCSKTQM
jgi:hypothetical protein